VPDRLYLSLWIRDFTETTLLRHFRQALGVIPFSKLRTGIAALRVHALEFAEPPLVEHAFPEQPDLETVERLAREFDHPDCAYTVDGFWELWKYDGDWALRPSPVSITCFGPEFENDEGDHLRLDLGAESDFLPDPGLPGSPRKAQSNLASLVRLSRELQRSLPLSRRRLWLDSGEDFAAAVDSAFGE
jgi:hypothetical protein